MKLFEFLWVRNGKFYNFWAEPTPWYWYQKWVPIPIGQRQSGTGTGQSGACSHSPVKDWYRYQPVPIKVVSVSELQTTLFCTPCTVKSDIRTPIV